MYKKPVKVGISVISFLLLSTLFSSVSQAEDTLFWKALTGGKFDFSARYRYEHVDDNATPDQANASTIRTTLGYTSGLFYNFGLRLQAQDVRDVFTDDFNDATGRAGAKTRYAVVADPSDTDLLEGYLRFAGLPETNIKLGRQTITYRNAPFHRFMGTVLWRQNWQNHDAFSIENTTLPDTTIRYAYSWNVNRIFSDEAIGARANWDSDSHFLNIQYDGFPYAKLEGYTYLLDFNNDINNSVATYDSRMNGAYPFTEKSKILYTAEYATQDDYGKNPANVDKDYFLGEIGGNFIPAKLIDSITLKFSYELLEGDGRTSFRTPLATGHAFQGWTDRFLTTPADGIEDYYVTAVIKAFGTTFIASYHDINSDNMNYDYGDELDLLIQKTFLKHYTLGSKVGIYDADTNATNLLRGGNLAADITKIWAWLEVQF